MGYLGKYLDLDTKTRIKTLKKYFIRQGMANVFDMKKVRDRRGDLEYETDFGPYTLSASWNDPVNTLVVELDPKKSGTKSIYYRTSPDEFPTWTLSWSNDQQTETFEFGDEKELVKSLVKIANEQYEYK